jgi:hypothetical protein
MPELSRFLGIVIGIFPREHPPPHFHAVYGEYQIQLMSKLESLAAKFPEGLFAMPLNGTIYIKVNCWKTGI